MNIPFEKIADILQQPSIYVESDLFITAIHDATNHESIYIYVDNVLMCFNKDKNRNVSILGGTTILLTSDKGNDIVFTVGIRFTNFLD